MVDKTNLVVDLVNEDIKNNLPNIKMENDTTYSSSARSRYSIIYFTNHVYKILSILINSALEKEIVMILFRNLQIAAR